MSERNVEFAVSRRVVAKAEAKRGRGGEGSRARRGVAKGGVGRVGEGSRARRGGGGERRGGESRGGE